MQVDPEALRIRINHLKKIITECPAPRQNTSEDIQHIIKTAPYILQDMEDALQADNVVLIEKIYEDIQTDIEWAVGRLKGE